MEKNLLLLDEYRKGFSEIANLVEGFKDISQNTQKIFLETRENVLRNQIRDIEDMKYKILGEVKWFLAKYNSKLLALNDMTESLNEELKKCNEMKLLIQGIEEQPVISSQND